MNMLEGDICRGCSFDNGDWTIQCRIKNKGLQDECPCNKCLVTCMCNKTCAPYDELFKKVHRMK